MIHLRIARIDDIPEIEALMKRSMQELGKGYYSQDQIDACCEFVCVPDRQIIEDRTFFVAVTPDSTIVGCGGWSFRNTLYAGPKSNLTSDKLNPSLDAARIRAMFIDPKFGGKGIGSMILAESEKAAKAYGFMRGALGATLSGLAFYKSKGWVEVSEQMALLPNGTSIGVIQMVKNF